MGKSGIAVEIDESELIWLKDSGYSVRILAEHFRCCESTILRRLRKIEKEAPRPKARKKEAIKYPYLPKTDCFGYMAGIGGPYGKCKGLKALYCAKEGECAFYRVEGGTE